MKISTLADSSDQQCYEKKAPENALVIFGASGDLTQRKLLGSLYELFVRKLLPGGFFVIGCGRTELSDDGFRAKARQLLGDRKADQDDVNRFCDRLHYISGQYDDTRFYDTLREKLSQFDQKYSMHGSHIFYLAVPPQLFGTIIDGLGQAGLTCGEKEAHLCRSRLVIEKPFGHDLDSARQLNDKLHEHFNEAQIYRIDHYLGKETVQNILMFRFANSIFEPIWNRNYIDHVQVTIAESLGVEHRAGYYDKTGALRDMFQNHLLQILALVGMEPPVSFSADPIRDEKVKLLGAVRPFNADNIDKLLLRGQYGPGKLNGKNLAGYRDEQAVAENSNTETFVAAKLFIDNWRWHGVPFYVRTGKRLPRKLTEVAITFKKVPYSLFATAGIENLPANVLVFQIQPDEKISLSFQAKSPGSKLCIKTLDMDFDYEEVFQQTAPEAYQRLLLDCMIGDQTLFNRQDDVELAWKLVTPILEHWHSSNDTPFVYPACQGNLKPVDDFISQDGRSWRSL
ncbi:MAG: glucose-6-phosphate dehydrogenase [Sedimentisphaerales bacterium]|nr:glucose-6-phosphate dehydrogenase [Sedimentisphaerales bacterium]